MAASLLSEQHEGGDDTGDEKGGQENPTAYAELQRAADAVP